MHSISVRTLQHIYEILSPSLVIIINNWMAQWNLPELSLLVNQGPHLITTTIDQFQYYLSYLLVFVYQCSCFLLYVGETILSIPPHRNKYNLMKWMLESNNETNIAAVDCSNRQSTRTTHRPSPPTSPRSSCRCPAFEADLSGHPAPRWSPGIPGQGPP